MRILWLNIGGLWPLNTGGRLRSFHILSELSRRHRITLLTTHLPGEDPQALRARLPRCEQIVSIPHAIPKWTSARFPLTLLRSWLSPLPVDLWKCRAPALRQAARLVATQAADVCVADFLVAAPNVPFSGAAPVVFFAHNVEHMIWKRLHDNESRAWRRALLDIEWRKMRRYEAETCRRARLTVAVSPQDRDVFARLAPGAEVSAVPTGVDVSYFVPNGMPESPDRLVYVGSMDWHPNEDAILYFIDAILPLIRRERPAVLLTVVGRHPSARLRQAAAGAGVDVTGTVEDIRPFVADAAAVVVPLRVGGGTRLKIFEALAMGKAVISTAVGAEGLPLTDGVHFMRADAPAEFAGAVTALLRDPERRRELGMAGRRLVEARYSWAQVATEFEAFVEAAGKRSSEESCTVKSAEDPERCRLAASINE